MAPEGESDRWQAELFRGVGAVVVAGGHVEWGMQQVLLSIRTGCSFDGLENVWSMQWHDLAKAIRGEGKPHPRQPQISGVMASEARLNRLRNDVVHAYWALDGGLRGARHTPKGDRYIIVGGVEELSEMAEELFDFARRLGCLASELAS
jgi:hypothetical protein